MSMTDREIVERLRERAPKAGAIELQAADAIERLTAENQAAMEGAESEGWERVGIYHELGLALEEADENDVESAIGRIRELVAEGSKDTLAITFKSRFERLTKERDEAIEALRKTSLHIGYLFHPAVVEMDKSLVAAILSKHEAKT